MKRKAATYTVDKIVDQKVENGKKYYLVKWEGYDSDANTWEPEKNIKCPTLIETFNRSLASVANGSRQNDGGQQGRADSSKTPETEMPKAANGREWEMTVTTADMLRRTQRSSESKESTAHPSKSIVVNQKAAKAKTLFKGEIKTDGQEGSVAHVPAQVDMTAVESAGRIRPGRAVAAAKRTGPALDNDKRRRVGPYKGRRKGGILAPVEMKPVEIIGALPENGSTKFLTRFQGTDDVKFMSREEAVKLYPQLVIDFYQSKIQWIMDREWMYGAQQAK